MEERWKPGSGLVVRGEVRTRFRVRSKRKEENQI